MHTKVAESFDKMKFPIGVHVPGVEYFVSREDDEWWFHNLNRFPVDYRMRTPLLGSQRILPLPKPIRESLVDTYCPKKIAAQVKADPANKDCLVRVYLGKRRQRINTSFFQLRNFPLHLDQMEELELDIHRFAKGWRKPWPCFTGVFTLMEMTSNSSLGHPPTEFLIPATCAENPSHGLV